MVRMKEGRGLWPVSCGAGTRDDAFSQSDMRLERQFLLTASLWGAMCPCWRRSRSDGKSGPECFPPSDPFPRNLNSDLTSTLGFHPIRTLPLYRTAKCPLPT